MTDKRKKMLTSVGALLMAALIGLGGTYAWQSISQTALNVAAATVNPGGRLHDDFDGSNKDVYVENFTGADDGTPIFARVRLDEYMEIGTGAGTDRNLDKDAPLTTTGLTIVGQGSKINDKSTWITRKPGGGSAFEEYYTWDMEGGQTVYMPTFNKNKDSLKADINGTYDGKPDTDIPFDDYVTYSLGQQIIANATYDNDNNDIEDDGVITQEETHTAAETINGTVITMEEWATRWQAYQTALVDNPEANPTDYNVKGDFWVWDADGWAYWANPIEPSTATGLLLDGIELVNPPSDSFYYGINVVGQFVTADDIGYLNGTGFYDRSAGKVPSANAENLLEIITGNVIEVPPTDGEIDTVTSAQIKESFSVGSQYSIATIDDTEWYVLAVDYDTDRALILSRYVLEQRAFDADGNVYWKDSDLRTYLNEEWLPNQEELYNSAVETTLYEVDNDGVLSTTNDKVFLLSAIDVFHVYKIYDPRLATYYEWDGTGEGKGDILPVNLQKATTAEGTETKWWTRSYEPTTSTAGTPYRVTMVSDSGTSSYNAPTAVVGVRPAMWIQLETDKTPTVSNTLDFETSAAVRNAEIQSVSTLSTDSYATVLIDDVEWYVLKVQDNKALLLSKYAESEDMNFNNDNRNVSEEQWQRFFPTANKTWATSTADSIWATSDIHNYLNGKWLSMHPTLSAAAADTEIKTRFYIYDDETEYWVTSNDKVFVLSEADMYGTTFDVTKDIWDSTNTTTAKADEYTLGTEGIILPQSLRATYTFRNTDSQAQWFLRNSRHYTSGTGIAAISGISMVGSLGASDGKENLYVINYQSAIGYCRPALWVNLNPTYASITVTPPADAVDYNSSTQLSASVSVNGSPVTSPQVSWTIKGATSADTKITGNTLTIGADEQNTRLQVIASYIVDGQAITDTIYVTVNPAPARLNAEDSAAIRAADISKKGLELPAVSYDVINFDALDFYVLAVDEENDLALIFSKDIVGKGSMGNDSSAKWDHVESWARKTLNGSWLNEQPTLSQVVQETEIRFYTLKGYSSKPELNSCVDKVFVPSYADVTGLSAMDQTSPAEEGELGEYTWNNQKLIPESLLPVEEADPFISTWWLRSSDNQDKQKASMLSVYMSDGEISSAMTANSSQGLRPMMWIRISAE